MLGTGEGAGIRKLEGCGAGMLLGAGIGKLEGCGAWTLVGGGTGVLGIWDEVLGVDVNIGTCEG